MTGGLLDVDDEYFTPGQVVPAGRYTRVDSLPAREVELSESGRLPASLDGKVALYRRLPDFLVSVPRPDLDNVRTRGASSQPAFA